jgi:hypothetical protein
MTPQQERIRLAVYREVYGRSRVRMTREESGRKYMRYCGILVERGVPIPDKARALLNKYKTPAAPGVEGGGEWRTQSRLGS